MMSKRRRRKGFAPIDIVLTIAIILLAFLLVTSVVFPKLKFLQGWVTSQTTQQLQVAVQECQFFHEQLDFLENMVDQSGIRASISEAGLNGGGATINCCSKDSPGCSSADSTPTECVQKCAAILKLQSECAKYYPPSADCYKDVDTRLGVEG